MYMFYFHNDDFSFPYVVAFSGAKEISRDHEGIGLGHIHMLISLLIVNLCFIILSLEAIALLEPIFISLIAMANSSCTVDLSLYFCLFLCTAVIH